MWQHFFARFFDVWPRIRCSTYFITTLKPKALQESINTVSHPLTVVWRFKFYCPSREVHIFKITGDCMNLHRYVLWRFWSCPHVRCVRRLYLPQFFHTRLHTWQRSVVQLLTIYLHLTFSWHHQPRISKFNYITKLLVIYQKLSTLFGCKPFCQQPAKILLLGTISTVGRNFDRFNSLLGELW